MNTDFKLTKAKEDDPTCCHKFLSCFFKKSRIKDIFTSLPNILKCCGCCDTEEEKNKKKEEKRLKKYGSNGLNDDEKKEDNYFDKKKREKNYKEERKEKIRRLLTGPYDYKQIPLEEHN